MIQASPPQLRWDERDVNSIITAPFVIAGEGKAHVLQQLHYDFEMIFEKGGPPMERRTETWVDVPVNKLDDKQ